MEALGWLRHCEGASMAFRRLPTAPEGQKFAAQGTYLPEMPYRHLHETKNSKVYGSLSIVFALSMVKATYDVPQLDATMELSVGIPRTLSTCPTGHLYRAPPGLPNAEILAVTSPPQG